MARTFGTYSPVVPLGTTWEESLSSRIGLAEMVENKDRRFGAALEGTV